MPVSPGRFVHDKHNVSNFDQIGGLFETVQSRLQCEITGSRGDVVVVSDEEPMSEDDFCPSPLSGSLHETLKQVCLILVIPLILLSARSF